MSNDRYKEIRKALAMGPTPGPWSVRYDYVVQAKSFDEGRLVPIAQPYGLRIDGSDLFANARLIAACDPDTIRALLAERDQLAAALEAAREDAERYRWLRAMAKEQFLNPKAAGAEYSPDMRTYWSIPTLICSGPVGGHIDFDAAIDQARGKAGQEVE